MAKHLRLPEFETGIKNAQPVQENEKEVRSDEFSDRNRTGRSSFQPALELIHSLLTPSSTLPKPVKIYETYYDLFGGWLMMKAVWIKKVTTCWEDGRVQTIWIRQSVRNLEQKLDLDEFYGSEQAIHEEICRIRGLQPAGDWNSTLESMAVYMTYRYRLSPTDDLDHTFFSVCGKEDYFVLGCRGKGNVKDPGLELCRVVEYFRRFNPFAFEIIRTLGDGKYLEIMEKRYNLDNSDIRKEVVFAEPSLQKDLLPLNLVKRKTLQELNDELDFTSDDEK